MSIFDDSVLPYIVSKFPERAVQGQVCSFIYADGTHDIFVCYSPFPDVEWVNVQSDSGKFKLKNLNCFTYNHYSGKPKAIDLTSSLSRACRKVPEMTVVYSGKHPDTTYYLKFNEELVKLTEEQVRNLSLEAE